MTCLVWAEEPNVSAAGPKVNESTTLESDDWAWHWQVTNITQKHADFAAAYSGAQSLSPQGPMVETTDATLQLGRRLWRGAEGWVNAEIDQGAGFNGTLGVAGFPSGGAYKIGANMPYLRFPKLFLRQTVNLGANNLGSDTKSAAQPADAGPNQFAMNSTANNVVITVGKFSITDIFDTNSYAHDPRGDFLNWSVIDAGTYDYGADPWGYTWGAAVEWNQDWWTLRFGSFQLSSIPNGKITRIHFGSTSNNLELEARHEWAGHPGKIKLLAWINQGKMGSYQDALQLGEINNTAPSTALVRRETSRPGVVLNMEQELSTDTGAFARLSANRGDQETVEFTDINQSISAGLQIKGNSWQRQDDSIGVAVVVNRLSGAAQQYFAAGGLGLLIGDGRLNYTPEKIIEVFYGLRVTSIATATLDYQHIINPAYNQDRGPVSVFGVRLHAGF